MAERGAVGFRMVQRTERTELRGERVASVGAGGRQTGWGAWAQRGVRPSRRAGCKRKRGRALRGTPAQPAALWPLPKLAPDYERKESPGEPKSLSRDFPLAFGDPNCSQRTLLVSTKKGAENQLLRQRLPTGGAGRPTHARRSQWVGLQPLGSECPSQAVGISLRKVHSENSLLLQRRALPACGPIEGVG